MFVVFLTLCSPQIWNLRSECAHISTCPQNINNRPLISCTKGWERCTKTCPESQQAFSRADTKTIRKPSPLLRSSNSDYFIDPYSGLKNTKVFTLNSQSLAKMIKFCFCRAKDIKNEMLFPTTIIELEQRSLSKLHLLMNYCIFIKNDKYFFVQIARLNLERIWQYCPSAPI